MMFSFTNTELLVAQGACYALRIGYPTFVARIEKTCSGDSEVFCRKSVGQRHGPALSYCRQFLLYGPTCTLHLYGNTFTLPSYGHRRALPSYGNCDRRSVGRESR